MESILRPELKLVKEDEYYLFYEMLMQTLKTDNVKEGINKSLSLLRLYLKSGNIVLYKKNEDGTYIKGPSDSKIDELHKPISCMINKLSNLVEIKGFLEIDEHLSDRMNNIMMLNIHLDNNSWILFINQLNSGKELEPKFFEKVKDTMYIILKRSASYERNIKAISTDLLTGLDNRNSYEMRIENLNKSNNKLVYGLFDLFQLKYINDNYSHETGDAYIKKTAKILNKYWPKYTVTMQEDGTEKHVETGHCIYRIGGDEFALLSTTEDIRLTKMKAKLAQEEIGLIDLGIEEDVSIGINYGIVEHNQSNSIKNTSIDADTEMKEDKSRMYKHLGIERRK